MGGMEGGGEIDGEGAGCEIKLLATARFPPLLCELGQAIGDEIAGRGADMGVYYRWE